jgi:D-hydroxyproline dehydrogenase subunit beta
MISGLAFEVTEKIIIPQSALGGVFDLAVVGAGIVGLSCARAAALRGLRVIVIDRDAQANGASVRNFGFVTVTGQERGLAWERARRACAIWQQVAEQARIPILQRGMWMTTRRAEGVAVLEAFMNTEMAQGCELLDAAGALKLGADFVTRDVRAMLVSSIDVRVESREAIPRIAAWLSEQHGVVFMRHTAVLSVRPPQVETARGIVQAGAVVVCPGDDLVGLFADRIAHYGVTRCKLQMLRLGDPGRRLPSALMSDLGLVRYGGYAALPEAAALRARLDEEQPQHLANGVHLIIVQSADGTLVVGDSHHYADTPDFSSDARVDQLILDEFAAATGRAAPPVIERWTGTYSAASGRTMFMDAPAPRVRLAMVTGGSGASTGFAIGEDVIHDLFEGSAA